MDNECGARPCKPAGHKRTPWWDESITPEASQEQIDTMDPEVRAAIDAQDNAIDEQEVTIDKLRKDVDRWMDDLEKRGDETSDNEAAIKALQATLAEQSALITGQRAAIEELRGWSQECADGVSNLGMRVAKLEDKVDQEETARKAGDKSLLGRISGWRELVERITSRGGRQ